MLNRLEASTLTPELYCTDIEKSLVFYTEILGFSIQYQRVEDGFAMLERQGSRIMLDQMRESGTPIGRTWIAAPLERPFGRGINLQIVTDKVDDLYATAKNAGATIFLAMEEKWYRKDDLEVGNRQFIVLDPDGYMLRFFQDLGERALRS